jgi:hypothetical protein
MPGVQRVVLQRASVGEADRPRLDARQPVDRVEMRGGQPRVLAARQEHDPRHRRGHVPAQAAQRRGRHLAYRRGLVTVVALDHHVGLEQHRLQRHRLLVQRIEHRLQHVAGDRLAALDGVIAVHQHFRLDNGHEPLFLAERGVAGKRVGVGGDAHPARVLVGDPQHRAPLGEPGAEPAVGGQPLAQAIEPLGHRLLGRAGERLGSHVHLHARQHALLGQHLRQRPAARGVLVDGLVLQDDAADELGLAGRGEQHLAVGAASLLRGRNT